MQMLGAGGEGDHYPWKITVNQRTGERIVPTAEPSEARIRRLSDPSLDGRPRACHQ